MIWIEIAGFGRLVAGGGGGRVINPSRSNIGPNVLRQGSDGDDTGGHDEEPHQQRPHEPQVLVVADLCDRQAAHDDHIGRGGQAGQTVAQDPRGDGGGAVHAGKVGQRR